VLSGFSVRRWILVVLAGFTAPGFSGDRIREDLNSGRISQADAVYYEALRLVSPDDLPGRYARSDPPVIKSGTPAAFGVRQAWSRLTAVQRDRLRPVATRPRLPFSYVSPDGLFRVHYDTSGVHAVLIEDLNGSGVPDYIERAAEYLDLAYDVQIRQMGFRVPPADPVDGPEWDAYIENLPGTYGWTTPDVKVSVSPDRYTAYMRFDNDYNHTYSKGLDGLRVTTAHEFFHVVQFGYVARDESGTGDLDDRFLMEASATWMEDVVHGDVNDYLNYLPHFFSRNNVRFDHVDGIREYGLSIWFHFLEKRYPGMPFIRLIWETLVTFPALRALDEVLTDFGSSFGRQLALFYGWNRMTGSRADTIRFYPEGHLYPEIRTDGAFTFTKDTMLTEWVRPTAARYYEFREADGYNHTLIPVNTGSPAMLSGECNVPLLIRDTHTAYTEISPGRHTGLLSEDDVVWELTAVVRDPDGSDRMIRVPTTLDAPLGSISGIVWHDVDRNGLFDEEMETGIRDVRLSLTEAGEDGIFGSEDDVLFPAAVTQAGGRFRFPGLEPGVYRVELSDATLPDGFVSTTGDPARTVILSENTDVTSLRFGFAPLDWLPAAFPQPFHPALHGEMKIPFTLQEAGTVRLALYTLSGYRLLEETAHFSGGLHFFRWSGLDSRDHPVPAGVYLYVLEADSRVLRREKIAVVR